MAKIFLSYRRSDSAYVAANLSDKLQQHFGRDSVFFDIDTIPLGVDFREYIGNAVGQCDVLLAVIGDQWVRAVDAQGNRRIDNPSDFVRVEIESALKRDIPVIPVLVGETEMPSADDLPEAIQSIVYRNATELRAGRDLRQHIDLLIQGLESLFKLKNVPQEKPIAAKEPDIKPAKVSDKADASELVEEMKKSLEGLAGKSLFIGTIPPKKLKNAINTYATQVAPEDVLVLYDDTVFGGAKDGFLLTADAVYWRNDGGDEAEQFRYTEIRKVDFLKYSASAAVILNEKEIKITMADDKDKLAESVANVIRRLVP